MNESNFRDTFYSDFGLTKLPKEWLDKQELTPRPGRCNKWRQMQNMVGRF